MTSMKTNTLKTNVYVHFLPDLYIFPSKVWEGLISTPFTHGPPFLH